MNIFSIPRLNITRNYLYVFAITLWVFSTIWAMAAKQQESSLLTSPYGMYYYNTTFEQTSLNTQSNKTTNNYIHYQEQYSNEESGLHYNRYRYYDPHAGQFVGQDPIGLNSGLNVYQYGDNAFGWVDPLGLSHNKPVANSEGAGVLFGQKRVGPTFGVKGRSSYLAGRKISDVAADLHAGHLHPDQLPIDAFKYNGQLVSANTRSLSALSEAGLQPTNVNIVQPSRALLQRLQETPLLPDAPLPGPRVPVTPSQHDLAILRVIETP